VRGGERGRLRASKEKPMKMRIVWSGLVASAVLLASGAAFSGGTTTDVAELMDFDKSTSQLWAYPQGQALTAFQHTPHTQHLLAELSHLTPPDPCIPLGNFWNQIVRFDERHNVNSTLAFETLLTLMSDYQCRATVTSVPTQGGGAAALVSIRPSK
jgi:hypothetical protein